MSRHVALLRGINVGGSGVIRMEELRAIFAKAGAEEVSTYIASGNVLFSASARDLPGIRTRAQSALAKRLGPAAATVYRTAAELIATAERDPFRAIPAGADVRRHVLFLDAAPAKRPRLPLFDEDEACELIALHGRDAFVVGHRKKKGLYYGFPNNWVERDLGVTSTTRGWNTVEKLAALLRGPS